MLRVWELTASGYLYTAFTTHYDPLGVLLLNLNNLFVANKWTFSTVSTLPVPHISDAYKSAGCIWASKILLNTHQSVQFIVLPSAFKMVLIFRLAFGIKFATACVVLSLVVNVIPWYLYEFTTLTSTSP